MSNEAHLAENAIMAYKYAKDYFEGFRNFDNGLNRDQMKEVFGDADNIKSLYEIIIEAYDIGRQELRSYVWGEE